MAIRLCKSFRDIRRSFNSAYLQDTRIVRIHLVYSLLKHSHRTTSVYRIRCDIYNSHMNLTISSTTFGGLTILSMVSLLSIVMLCILINKLYMPIESVFHQLHLIECCKISAFSNAGNWIELLCLAVMSGLNLSYILDRAVNCLLLCVGGLLMKVNPVTLAGNNPVHYLLTIGAGNIRGSDIHHDYSLINMIGGFWFTSAMNDYLNFNISLFTTIIGATLLLLFQEYLQLHELSLSCNNACSTTMLVQPLLTDVELLLSSISTYTKC